jgi:hypothetical protein
MDMKNELKMEARKLKIHFSSSPLPFWNGSCERNEKEKVSAHQ